MTRTRLSRGEIGLRLAEASEWVHLVAASALIYPSAGPGWVGIYFVLSGVLALVVPRGEVGRPRWLGLASPMGMLLLAITSVDLSAAPVLAAAVLVGVGHAAVGRSPALTGGLLDGVGRPAVVGAAAAVLIMPTTGPVFVITVAALTMSLAALMGGVGHHPGPVSPVLLPSLLGLSGVAGLRVLEPVLAGSGPASHTVMTTAWALGAYLGSRTGMRSDARAVLAAPFIAAMALAGMAVVRGWGELFLYAGIAGALALVGGASDLSTRALRMAPSRVGLLMAVLAGALFASARVPLPGAPDELLLWPPAAALLVGAFISLFYAFAIKPRPAAVETPAEPERIPEPEPVPVVPEPVPAEPVPVVPAMDEIQAAQLLLDALRQARAIRSGAIALLRSANDPVAYAAQRFLLETGELRQRLSAQRTSSSAIPTE